MGNPTLSRITRRLALPALLALAGCAASTPPPLFPQAGIQPAFPIPSPRERMVYLAQQEWALFGRPVVDFQASPPTLVYPTGSAPSHESQPPFFSRVLLYWYAVSSLPMLGYNGELRPWSAAFISWLARGAGIAPQDLPSSVLHWDYIAHSLAAQPGARFIAHDAKAYAPGIGDLLCAPRGEDFIKEISDFAHLRRGPYHCDLVVARRGQELEVIGGNVLDVVALTRVALDAQGHPLPTPDRPWRVVIAQQDLP